MIQTLIQIDVVHTYAMV